MIRARHARRRHWLGIFALVAGAGLLTWLMVRLLVKALVVVVHLLAILAGIVIAVAVTTYRLWKERHAAHAR